MRILIDLQACQGKGSRKRGIGRYSHSLAKTISQLRDTNEVRLALSGICVEEAAEIEDLFSDILPKQFISRYYYPEYPVVNQNPTPMQLFQSEIGQVLIQQHYASLQPDVLHISSVFEGESGRAVTLQANKLGELTQMIRSATLYDLIPLLFKDKYLTDPTVRAWYYNRLGIYRVCDVLLAISESTRQDAINHLGISPDKVINISSACDSLFMPITIEAESVQKLKASYGISMDFVLYTGGDDARKNMEGLIKSYANIPQHLRKNLQLVFVCEIQASQKAVLINLAKKAGMKQDEIVFTGFVPDEDLVKLYNICKLFIFPSKYEGFGLPVLEAMQCGAPVIGANNSSICEIIQRSDALFDANNTEEMTQALVNVLSNEGLQRELAEYGIKRSKDFSWKKSAEISLQAFREAQQRKQAVNKTQVAALLPRRKIAYFSPLPDQQSGIADYSADLLPHLSRYFEIDLFIDDYKVEDDTLIHNYQIRNYREYPALHKNYDLTLYHMGNSHFHAHMYDLVLRYSGVIVLHDFYLSGLINYVACMRADHHLFENELSYSHGKDKLDEFTETNAEKRRLDMINQYPCNRRILENAQGIIVHSAQSKNLINQFFPEKISAPVHIIKQMHRLNHRLDEAIKMANKQKIGFAKDDFIICSFGLLNPLKLNDVLLEAFIDSKLFKLPQVKLVFVGDLPKCEFEQKLKARIENLRVAEKIYITGHVNAEDYQNYLSITDLAVQLRAHSRGETSRAVLDCLAYGIPTIVNDYVTFTEYADDLIYKIPAEAPVKSLSQGLQALYEDHKLRNEMSKKALEYMKTQHDAEIISAEYAFILHKFIENTKFTNEHGLIARLGAIMANYPILAADEMKQIAAYAVDNGSR